MEQIVAQNIILSFSAFVVAFVITCLSIHLVIRLSNHLELFDMPNERKLHTGKISRLGGIGIFLAFIISVAISPIIIGIWLKSPFSVYGKISSRIMLILPTLLIFMVGLLDDFRQLRARYKLIIQVVAALIVIFAGARIEQVTLPLGGGILDLGIWSWPITLIWIVGITNAMNLIDGMDGLSATIGVIAFATYGIVFLLTNHFMLSVISFVLVGTLLGYLMFNYPPARIFMGDSGALVIGFLLAVLPMVAETSGTIMYMPVTLLFIPIADVFIAMFRRIRRRVSFMTPDKEHFHHKLLALGLRERGILMVVASAMSLSALPIIISTVTHFENIFVYFLAIWLIISAGFIAIHFIHKNLSKK